MRCSPTLGRCTGRRWNNWPPATCATKWATDALALSRASAEPETSSRTTSALLALARDYDEVKALVGRYFTRSRSCTGCASTMGSATKTRRCGSGRPWSTLTTPSRWRPGSKRRAGHRLLVLSRILARRRAKRYHAPWTLTDNLRPTGCDTPQCSGQIEPAPTCNPRNGPDGE